MNHLRFIASITALFVSQELYKSEEQKLLLGWLDVQRKIKNKAFDLSFGA